MARRGEQTDGWGFRFGRAIAPLVLIAALVGVVLLIRALVPSEAPKFKDPGVVDAIFANRLTITIVRVTLLFAALYVVVSVVALISRGQWLSRVGPFAVEDSVRTLERERDRLATELRDAVGVIGRLEGELREAAEELATRQ